MVTIAQRIDQAIGVLAEIENDIADHTGPSPVTARLRMARAHAELARELSGLPAGRRYTRGAI